MINFRYNFLLLPANTYFLKIFLVSFAKLNFMNSKIVNIDPEILSGEPVFNGTEFLLKIYLITSRPVKLLKAS